MSYTTMHNAAKKFAKETYDNEMANAWIGERKPKYGIMGANLFHYCNDPDGMMRQYITDGFVGVSYSIPFDDLATPPKTDDPVNYNLVCRTNKKYTRLVFEQGVFPDYKSLKELWKLEKKRCVGHPKDRNRLYRLVVGINNYTSVVVDIELLIRFMELTDCHGGETYYWTDPITPVFVEKEINDKYIQGLEILALLCPIRMIENKRCLNDPESENAPEPKKQSKITYMWGRDHA